MNNDKIVFATDKSITVILRDEKGEPRTVFINDTSVSFDQIMKMSEDEIIDKYCTFTHDASDKLREAHRIYKSLPTELKAEFLENNGVYYYKATPGVSIPENLFCEMMFALQGGVATDAFNALKLFWLRCLDNHNPQSRDDLFDFLKDNGFSITPYGFFETYRRVNEVFVEYKGMKYHNLYSFLQSAKEKARQWKKGHAKLNVVVKKDNINQVNLNAYGTYELVRKRALSKYLPSKYKVIGTLEELLASVKEGAVFTDAHTGTHRIKIGKTEELSRKECDYSNAHACSSGLHVGTPEFISKGHYGRVAIKVLVNPTDVVAVPRDEANKMRVCRYKPIDFVEYNKKGEIKPTDLENLEYKYSEESADDILERVANKSLTELTTHRLIPTEISFDAFGIINREIGEMSAAIADRKFNL